MSCLLFSCIFHLFQAVSPTTSVLMQKLDYAGIAFLIGGSNIPVIFYGFFCSPITRTVYMFAIGLISFIGFLSTLTPRCLTTEFRVVRVLIFLAMGFFGLVPTAHLFFHLNHLPIIFWYLIAMGALYVLGAAIYVTQVPERFAPGRFDIFCSSHQWWHVLIVIAVLVHYYGIIQFFKWRITHQCPL